ncbi:hypothetical protein PFISCL1PPCAC_19886, partial [Pristionchus fissidentatus]
PLRSPLCKEMSDGCSFTELLPEVQEVLSPHFSLVDCCLGIGPDLSRPPFNRPFRNLGQKVTYVPDSKVIADDLDKSNQHEIRLSETSFVLTDSIEGQVIEIALEGGIDWITPITLLFHKIFASKWTFLVAEVENGKAFFHVLSSNGANSNRPKIESSEPKAGNFSLWIVPVSKIFAIPAPQKKVKIVKRVVKKKSPIEGTEGANDGVVRKIVRKKKVETNEDTVLTRKSNGTNGREEENEIKDIPKLNGNKREDSDMEIATRSEKSPQSPNGFSDTLKEMNGKKEKLSISLDSSSSYPILHSSLPTSNSSKTPSSIVNGRSENSSDEEDISTLRREIMERDKLRRIGEEAMRKDSITRRPNSRSPTSALDAILEGKAGMNRGATEGFPLPMGRSGTFISHPSVDLPPFCILSLPQPSEIPVAALQIILRSQFSFEEIASLRIIHPHWDEICGQILNGGYYSLLERTDRMLMKYQRRLHSDSALHYAVSVLTSIQVHILNPVDIMRAALDEGICCFPYGLIIDRCISMLDQIDQMVTTREKMDIGWEKVGILSKRASIHYRIHLENVIEERMGTCARLKAAQRIIRMDSMIVEHNVQKLEKESMRSRDDLKWELEQMQQSYASLKKENRQLKADQMKLESRVESLETKLRSICRLLS